MSKSDMNIAERARFQGFMILDRMRGGKIEEKIRQDIKAYNEGTLIYETNEKIRNLIAHAVKTTGYYSKFPEDVDLADLPVINKDTWRGDYESFISSAYSDRKGCREMTTSGSTGTPFTMLQDPNKISMNTADSIFLGMLGGYAIGEKMAFIRVWVNNVKKGKIRLMMENSLMIDSSSLSDESIAKIMRTLRREHVKVLIGYSSALGEISRWIDATGHDTKKYSVRAIIPISETMPDSVRERLTQQFRCTCRAWYSNEENGIMGLQLQDSNGYYINSESYYYEILKMDSDEPAEDGELGRVVITDLTNYAFPILRYDNGDTAVARHEYNKGRKKLFLTELYGRRSDLIYDTKGRAVTPYIITNNFWDVEGVAQYQFIQTGLRDYELRLNGDRSVMNVDDMLGRIKPTLGENANINIVYVDEIPVLASGKRKYIENRCKSYDRSDTL